MCVGLHVHTCMYSERSACIDTPACVFEGRLKFLYLHECIVASAPNMGMKRARQTFNAKKNPMKDEMPGVRFFFSEAPRSSPPKRPSSPDLEVLNILKTGRCTLPNDLFSTRWLTCDLLSNFESSKLSQLSHCEALKV